MGNESDACIYRSHARILRAAAAQNDPAALLRLAQAWDDTAKHYEESLAPLSDDELAGVLRPDSGWQHWRKKDEL